MILFRIGLRNLMLQRFKTLVVGFILLFGTFLVIIGTSLLDAVDEDPLHGGDVLDHPGHDLSGAAAVEPAEGEALELLVEVGAEVIDDFLLKDVVEHDSEAIEAIPEQESAQRGPDEDQKEAPIAIRDDHIDEIPGDFWENDDRDCPEEGTGQLGAGEYGVAPKVGNDAENGLHGRAALTGRTCYL